MKEKFFVDAEELNFKPGEKFHALLPVTHFILKFLDLMSSRRS